MTTNQRFATQILILLSVVLGNQPAMAAATISTSQYRFLDGEEQASWGPVFLKATGGQAPYSWQLLSGTLPPGLVLEIDGRLEGITGTPGTYNFTLRATDALGSSASMAYRVRVHPAGVVRPPALPADRLPFSYVQSAWSLGTPGTAPRTGGEFEALINMYLTHFSGGEIFFNGLDSPDDFQQIRLFNETIESVRAGDPNADFLAVFSNGRLPGFYPQPPYADYQAESLKSDGSTWYRLPGPVSGDKFGLHARHVDITDDVAVDHLMKDIATAYDFEGPAESSVGRLNGFWVLNEAKATPLYYPFKVQPGEDEDLVPRGATRESCDDFRGGRPDDPPMLEAGDPCVLYVTNSAHFTFLQGPKRAIPMFSLDARDSFADFVDDYFVTCPPSIPGTPCLPAGFVVDYLPADRQEFNDADQEIDLVDHVRFVSTNPEDTCADTGPVQCAKEIWSAWENWVYETWFRYLERMSSTVRFAQAGNPYFRGILHFTPPGWYSFRGGVATEPIPYKYYDASEALQTVTGTSLSSSPHFGIYNDVTHATDVDRFTKSPWLQGFLHETTTPMMLGPNPNPANQDRVADRQVLVSSRGRYLWNQETAAARLVARRNGSFFGLFARYFYFVDALNSNHELLSAPDWGWNWHRVIHLNPPDYVATLPPHLYLDIETDIDPEYCSPGDCELLPTSSAWTGENGDEWLNRFQGLRSAYTRPAEWNPQSQGALWLFDGDTVGGWAYDPWSEQTALTVHLIGSPNNCHVGGSRQIATIFANDFLDPTWDTTVRTNIRNAVNYAPPEQMKFGFNGSLRTALQSSQLICGPGNYQLQLRVDDGQGDGRTKLLAYQGSTTLTVPVQGPSVRLDWMKPQHLVIFGPPSGDALILSGLVAGGTPTSKVTLVWRTPDMTPGTWIVDSYLTPPDPSTGRWYHSIAAAGAYNKFYEAYAIYEGVISPHCTYRADDGATYCGTGPSYGTFVSRLGGGNGTMSSSPPGISCPTDCGQVYAPGTVVTLNAAANASSVFVAWEGDADCVDGQVVSNQGLHCKGRFEPKGTALAKVTSLQPEPLAGYGPPGSLVIVGTASGAPAGTGVTLRWRDITTNGPWVTEAYASPPNAGTWYHSIPFANYLHKYQVYVTYGNTTSAGCTYAGNWAKTTCP